MSGPSQHENEDRPRTPPPDILFGGYASAIGLLDDAPGAGPQELPPILTLSGLIANKQKAFPFYEKSLNSAVVTSSCMLRLATDAFH